jgi:hypothetical protein
MTDTPHEIAKQVPQELDPVQTAKPEGQTKHPTTSQIRHAIFDPFGNPFLDRDFENDW